MFGVTLEMEKVADEGELVENERDAEEVAVSITVPEPDGWNKITGQPLSSKQVTYVLGKGSLNLDQVRALARKVGLRRVGSGSSFS
jgi:gamma-glutamylcysteine synthetase